MSLVFRIKPDLMVNRANAVTSSDFHLQNLEEHMAGFFARLLVLKTSSISSCMLRQRSDHISVRDSCLPVQCVAQTSTFDSCYRLVELLFFRYVFDGRALSRVPWTGVLCMRASLRSQINGYSSAGCFKQV
jgi:hypothetical protein